MLVILFPPNYRLVRCWCCVRVIDLLTASPSFSTLSLSVIALKALSNIFYIALVP